MSSQRQPRDGAPTVGVVGIGNMGEPMTLNLVAAGISVHAYTRTPSRLDRVVAAGALPAQTPRALAESSTIIISMLPDLPQLRALLEGDDGILAGIHGQTVLVIGSTSSPVESRELAERVQQSTDGLLHVVDAPVSGGTDGAAAATLSIMVGGSPADFARVEPILKVMGTPVLLGALGAGQVAKACNQMIVASTMLALSEAAVIAERSGLDLEALMGVLSGGYAGSNLLDSRKQRLIDKDYSVSGVAKFMVKDLGFARAAADSTATTTPQLTMLQDVYTDLVERGYGEFDLSVAHAYVTALSAPSASDSAL